MLANAMRGLATEFGLVVPKGMDKLKELMTLVEEDKTFRSKHAKRSLNYASTVTSRRSGSRNWSGRSSHTPGMTTPLGAWPQSLALARSPPR
jgi:hypothetical protein